ncbi:hypothetical protein EW093_06130 [Thiospirochaeta perfilievii]|uniref:DUF7402 domain-containing protein n=1 Tax=Thiospirochaeta perfilievii TaxID=252967 RepID=A0A5C1QCA9_9SPIO|nr:hypothetical protein [Thiospirochaeta perfilievii]QEN04296.1 hypothetical protein EW093_06130 [Thiospirochaeta perfilievii]
MNIKLTDRLGMLRKEVSGNTEALLTLNSPFGFEDEIHIKTTPKSFVTIELDKYIKPATIYTISGNIKYVIPVNWKLKAYHPDAFTQEDIAIKVSIPSNNFINSRRNLAFNSLDKRWDTGYFPHASANVVTRDEPWFEAKNAIDGVINQDGHGVYPYHSWGGGLREDLEFTLEFGRTVVIDEIRLYLRADFKDNHDIHWESGVLEFSDGHEMSVKMTGTKEADCITFEPRKVTWIKLHHLKREISAAFSALTQIEVFGNEV